MGFCVLLSLFLAASPVPVRKAKRVVPSSYALILGGGKTHADAEKALERYRAIGFEEIHPAKGFPKLFVSDDLKGLNKGFHIAVLGFCRTRGSALEANAALNAKLIKPLTSSGGAYFKLVQGSFPNGCPGIDSAPAPADDLTLVSSSLVFAGRPGATFEVLRNHPPGPVGAEDCFVPDLVIRVTEGGKVLDDEQLSGSCRPPSRFDDGSEDPGEATRFDLKGVMALNGRNFLMVEEIRSAADDALKTKTLYGFGKGKLTRLKLPSAGTYAAPGEISVSVTRAGDEVHDAFEISDSRDLPPASKSSYVWDDKLGELTPQK